jgi:hypothetical protein
MTKSKSISNEKVQIPDIVPFHYSGAIAFPYAVFFDIWISFGIWASKFVIYAFNGHFLWLMCSWTSSGK